MLHVACGSICCVRCALYDLVGLAYVSCCTFGYYLWLLVLVRLCYIMCVLCVRVVIYDVCCVMVRARCVFCFAFRRVCGMLYVDVCGVYVVTYVVMFDALNIHHTSIQ